MRPLGLATRSCAAVRHCRTTAVSQFKCTHTAARSPPPVSRRTHAPASSAVLSSEACCLSSAVRLILASSSKERAAQLAAFCCSRSISTRVLHAFLIARPGSSAGCGVADGPLLMRWDGSASSALGRCTSASEGGSRMLDGPGKRRWAGGGIVPSRDSVRRLLPARLPCARRDLRRPFGLIARLVGRSRRRRRLRIFDGVGH